MNSLAQRRAAFTGKLRREQCREHFETLFLYFSAPILRGARPAVLITLNPGCYSVWSERQTALRMATGLQTKEIINRNGTTLLLIYEEAALSKYLSDESITSFLSCHGYPIGSKFEEYLCKLQKRFLLEACPHEIGIFLGYPLCDVQSFIENGGKNCICCRYWKVYHNPEQAQKTFRLIDEAQLLAMEVLCRPRPIHIAVNLLKAG